MASCLAYFPTPCGHPSSEIPMHPYNNAVIYCSYLMTTSEEPIKEEAKGGDDSQKDNFISLSLVELLE